MDSNFGLSTSWSDQLFDYVQRDALTDEPDIPCNQNLNDEQLVVLGILMQGNLDIKNRVWGNRAYKKTFVGAEAAAWLTEFGFTSTEDIIAIGSRMLQNRFFDHMSMTENDDNDPFVFRNAHQFYRFNTSV